MCRPRSTSMVEPSTWIGIVVQHHIIQERTLRNNIALQVDSWMLWRDPEVGYSGALRAEDLHHVVQQKHPSFQLVFGVHQVMRTSVMHLTLENLCRSCTNSLTRPTLEVYLGINLTMRIGPILPISDEDQSPFVLLLILKGRQKLYNSFRHLNSFLKKLKKTNLLFSE